MNALEFISLNIRISTNHDLILKEKELRVIITNHDIKLIKY